MEKIFADYPKMIGALDDLHWMASSINDLRILVFVVTATCYVGGIIFLFIKFREWKSGGSSRRRRQEDGEENDWEVGGGAGYRQNLQSVEPPTLPLSKAKQNSYNGYHQAPQQHQQQKTVADETSIEVIEDKA